MALLIFPVFLILEIRNIKKIIISSSLWIISYLFWLPILIKQFSSGLSVKQTNWWNILGTLTFKNILLIPVKFEIGRVSFDNKTLYAGMVIVISLVFGFILFKARKAKKLFAYWLAVPIIMGVLISFRVPTLSYFRFLFCLPALYILLAVGISKLGRYKNVAVVTILGINLLNSGYYLFNTKFHREDWRSAAKAVGSQKIIIPSNSQKEALIYYGKGDQIIYYPDLDGKDQEIWLSRYVWEIFDPNDLARKKVESLGYNKVSEYNFNGVVFWKCTKTQYAYLPGH